MQGQKAMTYKQLFLLILTIWSAELVTAFLFDSMMTSQSEFRTIYVDQDQKTGYWLGSSVADLGRDGWQLKSVIVNPENQKQVIMFFERKRVRSFGQ